ncbi:ABC transporter substrate-binding protein [Streptomyces lonarensis]
MVGVTDRVDSLDPVATYSSGAWDLYSNIYQGLLTISTGSEEPVPDAAEKCEFTDNAYQVYRCTLREGLKFTSGRDVTPEDVAFSVERFHVMADRQQAEKEDESIPKNDKFAVSGPIQLVRGVEAVRVDGMDVIFELSEPDVTFPFKIAGGVGSILDREEYAEDEPTEIAVGSGPYRMTEFSDYDEDSDTTGQAVLEPNPDYKGALKVSDYPVTLKFFGTSAALEEAWRSGEIDVNGGKMEPEDIQRIDRNDLDIRYSETTGLSIRALVSTMDSGSPMADKELRKLAAMLIDRDAIARDVRLHTVEPAYSLIPVGVTGHGTPYYDLYSQESVDDAIDDVMASGTSLPVNITLGFAASVNQPEAELVVQQLEAEGVFNVTLVEGDTPGALPGAMDKKELDAYLIGWRPDFTDPDTYTDALLSSDSALAHGLESEEMAELMQQTRSELDRGNSGELFREIQMLAAEEAVVVPIWQDRTFVIADRSITGLQHLRDAGGQFRLWELERF